LIYRGTDDGFEAIDFHEKCDNYGETIVLIKAETKGGKSKIFVAYTDIPW
jgi:hypothetical protein